MTELHLFLVIYTFLSQSLLINQYREVLSGIPIDDLNSYFNSFIYWYLDTSQNAFKRLSIITNILKFPILLLLNRLL